MNNGHFSFNNLNSIIAKWSKIIFRIKCDFFSCLSIAFYFSVETICLIIFICFQFTSLACILKSFIILTTFCNKFFRCRRFEQTYILLLKQRWSKKKKSTTNITLLIDSRYCRWSQENQRFHTEISRNLNNNGKYTIKNWMKILLTKLFPKQSPIKQIYSLEPAWPNRTFFCDLFKNFLQT